MLNAELVSWVASGKKALQKANCNDLSPKKTP